MSKTKIGREDRNSPSRQTREQAQRRESEKTSGVWGFVWHAAYGVCKGQAEIPQRSCGNEIR